eukprot:NODE_108_length_19701_cov_0.369452.p10 type:complete len:144 gc:universal NODE_108_length_19701_cov_0.369452:3378-2947(-)
MEAFTELNDMMNHAKHEGMTMPSIINWKCCDITVLFDFWHVGSCTQMVFTLMALFLLTMGGEMIGAYKHPLASKAASMGKPWLVSPMLLLFGWVRSIIAALMMLALMTFNGYIILAITLASAMSRTICLKNVQLDEQEGLICH